MNDTTSPSPLLTVRGLEVSFQTGDAPPVCAVSGVGFVIHRRQTVALVGESGCGKSVTALAILGLLREPPACIEGGEIILNGRDLRQLSRRDMLAVRGREVAMIFQEPMSSLNPVLSIGDQVIEAIRLHQKVRASEARDRAVAALEAVGITQARRRLRAYPHQFSGGMRQRVMIAMALACQPRLLLADEPTTALDVTIQAQILDLLGDLQRTHDMGLLLITHDLGIVAERADVACVMYAGRIVECAAVADLFAGPLHPYTRGLLQCRPRFDHPATRLTTVSEVVGDAMQFTRIGSPACGGVPWWPAEKQSTFFRHHRLLEVARRHWVRCWIEPDESAPKHEQPPGIPASAGIADHRADSRFTAATS